MTPIIAGRFEQKSLADQAVDALRQEGFDAGDVTQFLVNPPEQDATFPIGGDGDASPGSAHAHSGALKGAAVGGAVGLGVGLAATALAGPAAVIVGASAGAYAGSLAGALSDMEDEPSKSDEAASQALPAAESATAPVRAAGILVAARAPEYAKRVVAVNVLRSGGARDIERAEGTWQTGRWVDFDPLKPPRLVDLPSP